ncbi:hypothetical protein ACJVDH_07275 [Pedobacter sp. AW1-32]|uniref:hypothetical protein n=1 Tax=Pedobacter sp. AW1-32 TaxID=3383026 RepID=UPI003FEF58C6
MEQNYVGVIKLINADGSGIIVDQNDQDIVFQVVDALGCLDINSKVSYKISVTDSGLIATNVSEIKL